jgi:hypothetical protein
MQNSLIAIYSELLAALANFYYNGFTPIPNLLFFILIAQPKSFSRFWAAIGGFSIVNLCPTTANTRGVGLRLPKMLRILTIPATATTRALHRAEAVVGFDFDGSG